MPGAVLPGLGLEPAHEPGPDERVSVLEHEPVPVPVPGRPELGLLVPEREPGRVLVPGPDEPGPDEPELVPAPLELGGEDEPGREDGPELELVHVPGPGLVVG